MIRKHIYNLICRGNKGTTLIEMIVAFALLGIFLSVATAVIVRIANLYYDIKGETYAEQVSDILLEKISSEIKTNSALADDIEDLRNMIDNG